MQARLREGIDAAKRGDRLTARRMLQQVLAYDRNNELALMWMASVVDTLDERRSFLQRALQLNPDNARAREALRRLSGEPDPAAGSAGATKAPGESGAYVPTADDARRASANAAGGRRRGGSVYLFAAAAVLVIMLVLVGIVLLNPARNVAPTPTLSGGQQTLVAFTNPSATPTRDLRPPTETVFLGLIVTFDASQLSPLPPTFTMTPTPSYTPTPFPSPTPLMLDSFQIVYTDFEPNSAAPSLYAGAGDGTGEIKLESGTLGGFTDAVVSPDGRSIAFVRDVIAAGGTPESGSSRASFYPQLFVAPFDDLTDAQPVTTLTGQLLSSPAWSPEGDSIVFVSDLAENSDIYRYDLDRGDVTQLTRGGSRNFDPSYAADSTILFSSDLNSPGFSEIYRMSAEGLNITRLTDEAGSSFAPVESPDGSRIAFISDRQGDADLYVMDANGQRPFLLTLDDAGAEDRSPSWSPNSRYIVFASNREDADAWYAVDTAGVIVRITENDRFPQSLSFVGSAN